SLAARAGQRTGFGGSWGAWSYPPPPSEKRLRLRRALSLGRPGAAPQEGACEPGVVDSLGQRPARPGSAGLSPPPLCAQNSNVENLPPHIIRLVYKEVTTLTTDPPDGIKVFPNEEDLTDLQVTIEGPEGTPYAGGLFRMKLLLGKDFPASPPKGYFLTKIFHPNVGANGEICVNVLKRDWTAELGIRHVLLTIKCLLIHPNPESALNEEAGRLAEGPMAKKHAGERDKKLAAKKKTDKKRALRRL
ncbi:PREDICTED: ubiquitin-conjugating enzyme E2 S, partial [Myotis davidii]|uniref:ubiquitin-conjugating enzyme E2 S n=1 Tax=Myotis davidii TaxID=225400 RepID=UPI0007671951